MSNGREFDKPGTYQIRVGAHLDATWSDWFQGWAILPQNNGETLLTGSVPDQIALHGLLTRIRDFGLPLLGVKRLEPDERARNVNS